MTTLARGGKSEKSGVRKEKHCLAERKKLWCVCGGVP